MGVSGYAQQFVDVVGNIFVLEHGLTGAVPPAQAPRASTASFASATRQTHSEKMTGKWSTSSVSQPPVPRVSSMNRDFTRSPASQGISLGIKTSVGSLESRPWIQLD